MSEKAILKLIELISQILCNAFSACSIIKILENEIFSKLMESHFAMEINHMRPDEVWSIGDQYECDVKGSLNAGLFPVWYIGAIDLPYTKDESILTVADWDELRRQMEE